MSDDKCNVCGIEMGPDQLHVLIDNGHVMRHTYCCRKHRYVAVEVAASGMGPVIQERSDREIESLAHAFRMGRLRIGWE